MISIDIDDEKLKHELQRVLNKIYQTESFNISDLKERFTYIVTFYDNDRPGMFNMAKIRRNHPELLYFFIPHKFKVKDISDFYKKYGRQNTLKFIKYYIKKLSNYVKK